MNLKSVKIFVCVIVVLTLYQSIQSQFIKEKYNDKKTIASGICAKLGIFPYMALVHRLIDNRQNNHRCSGTILSKRWVLTTAYCVEDYPRIFSVMFGIINKSGIKYDYFQDFGMSIITTRAFIHPEYRGTMNDIALLYMPRNILFSSVIQPIKIASYIYLNESYVNKQARIIGWEKDKIIGQSIMNLQYTIISIISNDECKQHWKINKKHICTASGLGKDACQGDSGSALVVGQQDELVGIMSYGDEFCPSNLPGVFTRVSSFIDWITNITNTYH